MNATSVREFEATTGLCDGMTVSRGILTLLLVALVSGPSCSSLVDGKQERVVHVVLVWLKDSGNAEHRARIIEATRGFSTIPGVEEIRVGGPIPNERPSADDSFDVGLYMVFSSRAALESYLVDPTHADAQKSILRPLVKRVVVYDFDDDGG